MITEAQLQRERDEFVAFNRINTQLNTEGYVGIPATCLGILQQGIIDVYTTAYQEASEPPQYLLSLPGAGLATDGLLTCGAIKCNFPNVSAQALGHASCPDQLYTMARFTMQTVRSLPNKMEVYANPAYNREAEYQTKTKEALSDSGAILPKVSVNKASERSVIR